MKITGSFTLEVSLSEEPAARTAKINTGREWDMSFLNTNSLKGLYFYISNSQASLLTSKCYTSHYYSMKAIVEATSAVRTSAKS